MEAAGAVARAEPFDPPAPPSAATAAATVSSDTMVAEARRSMVLAAAALVPYLLGIWLAADAFGIQLRYVVPTILGISAFDLILAATASRWSRSRFVGCLFGCPQVLMLTLLLYFLGGLRASFLVLIYTVTIFRTAVLGSAMAVMVTANVAAIAFGTLAVLEVNHLVPVHAGFNLGWEPTGAQATGVVFATWAVLNFIALYASRSAYQLRTFAQVLQQRVAERTASLTTANAALRSQTRALEEKQAEIKTLVDAVTHELKNPTNAILLTADLLREREGRALSDEGREDLDRIVRLAATAEDMIRDLLRLFEITSAAEAPGHVDLAALTARALDMLQPQVAAKAVTVTVGPLPAVWGQPRKLGSVISNLLGNAVKYVPHGRGRVDVTAERVNGSVILCVGDNGIGIADAYQTRIFELFRRVPAQEQQVDGEEFPGTGVGLAVVKQIVEAHGGAVWVESRPLAGSRFYVRLPARLP